MLFLTHRKNWRLSVLIAALFITRANMVLSYCDRPDRPRVCDEFFSSDLVFTGKVIATRYMPQGLPGSDLGWLYTLTVNKIYRGSAGPTVKVYSEANRGGFPLDTGKSYLLFAFADRKTLYIAGCGNSTVLGAAPTAIRQIETILSTRAGTGGSIGGRVVAQANDLNLSGIHLIANDGEKTYEAVTANDGSSNIEVPAGAYNLTAKAPLGLFVYRDDPAALKPNDIVIGNGQCADVYFSAMPKN
jgi:hypothetical protein